MFVLKQAWKKTMYRSYLLFKKTFQVFLQRSRNSKHSERIEHNLLELVKWLKGIEMNFGPVKEFSLEKFVNQKRAPF